MAFECPRRSSPPSPMFDADTGCIATDPAPSARRRFRSKTGIENLPANEHAQETPHTPSPTRTTRRIQSGCAGSRPRLRDGMPGSPSQHIDITRAKWIPYFGNYFIGTRQPVGTNVARRVCGDAIEHVPGRRQRLADDGIARLAKCRQRRPHRPRRNDVLADQGSANVGLERINGDHDRSPCLASQP